MIFEGVVLLYVLGLLITFLVGMTFAIFNIDEEADRRFGQRMIRMCWAWPVLLVSLVRYALKDEK